MPAARQQLEASQTMAPPSGHTYGVYGLQLTSQPASAGQSTLQGPTSTWVQLTLQSPVQLMRHDSAWVQSTLAPAPTVTEQLVA